MEKPILGILLGDAAGVGPEIVAKVLVSGLLTESCRPVIIGDIRILEQGLEIIHAKYPHYTITDLRQADWEKGVPVWNTGDQDPALVTMGQMSAYCGKGDISQFRFACALCLNGSLQGFLYGPMHKGAMKEAGMAQESETELVADLLGNADPYGEINMLGNLMTVRVTSHIPISAVSAHLNIPDIMATIRLARDTSRAFGVEAPRIAVSGLNPHNGENGKCGREELDIIAPAIELAQNQGWNVTGPYPADVVFMRAFRGDFDAVVTMYHDQGQIALKSVGFDQGVTISGGQPYPITTAAHGTAFGRAGQGRASTTAFENALKVLCRMAGNSAQ